MKDRTTDKVTETATTVDTADAKPDEDGDNRICIQRKVKISEIGKCCGFCERGRPIDLWYIKRVGGADEKTDREKRTGYAAPLVSELYSFCTGNARLLIPTEKWWNSRRESNPALYVLDISKGKYCVVRRIVGRDVHEPSLLRDGWLLICDKGQKKPSSEMYAAAHFLMACSERPEKSWCDIMSVAFNEKSGLFDYSDAFDLATPVDRAIHLTRVYYNEKLCKVVSLRMMQFGVMKDAKTQCKEWMKKINSLEEIEIKMKEHVRAKKPSEFLCNGEYESMTTWETCLSRSISMFKRRRKKSVDATGGRDGDSSFPSAEAKRRRVDYSSATPVETLFRGKESLGKPYLYLAK